MISFLLDPQRRSPSSQPSEVIFIAPKRSRVKNDKSPALLAAMMNGDIVPAMTGGQAVVAIAVVTFILEAVRRLRPH